MVANDKRPLVRREGDATPEIADNVTSGSEIFSSRLPGLAEDDDEEMAPLRPQEDGEGGDGGSSAEEVDGPDDDLSLDSGAGHVYGRSSMLHRILPEKGYAVFALGVVLSLVCYVAVPIVCLSASHQVLEHRKALPSIIASAPDWTLKLAALDRLQVRLHAFALYGDGMLLDGQNNTAPIVLSTRTASGGMATYSPVARSVLSDVERVLKDADDAVAYVAEHNTAASQYLSTEFIVIAAAVREYISTTFFPEATRLFEKRQAARIGDNALNQAIFVQIFNLDEANNVGATISLFSAAQALCATTPSCVSGGGLALLGAINRNVSSANYRLLNSVLKLVTFINDASFDDITQSQMISTVAEWNAYLDARSDALLQSQSMYQSTLNSIRRLVSLQSSVNGTLNTTGAPAPTSNETSLVAMLPTGWASLLYSSTLLAQEAGAKAFSALKTELDSKIEALLSATRLTGLGLESRVIQYASLFDSIYAYDFDNLPAPTDAMEEAQTNRFNANPLNAFFPPLRIGYQAFIAESTAAALNAAAVEEQNLVGMRSIDKIQIATSICTIVPIACMLYLVYGVAARLPSSPFPHSAMVSWLGVSYAIFVAASAAMAMIAINEIEARIDVHAADVHALSSVLQAADRSSAALTQAMDVLMLVQPNTSAPASNLQAAEALFATIAQDALDAPYAATIGVVIRNMTSPFLSPPLSAETLRQVLSSRTSLKPTADITTESVATESEYDVLPLCNQTRILGSLNYLLDSYGALQRVWDVMHRAESSLATRLSSQAVRSAKAQACSLCGDAASAIAANPTCRIPAAAGLHNNPRTTSFVMQVAQVTRSGIAVDAWNKSTNALVDYVTAKKAATLDIVSNDSSHWKLQRRLLVWVGVFGALILQVLWYGVWRATFDHTLHMNLLP